MYSVYGVYDVCGFRVQVLGLGFVLFDHRYKVVSTVYVSFLVCLVCSIQNARADTWHLLRRGVFGLFDEKMRWWHLGFLHLAR